ncbi:hypothetical protein HMPREF9441_00845 [Paraprevotella clara YIT 11840]|uniref:Uncharacterized protein n=1 Tax=Paraprevotella clara YIT 11840 TaxID=762968 RepID=G5SNB6_9BACT|nr:hypothetical protein HMPREF9441_00845 [Paraprevotella clara YIT 11840]
MQNGFFNPFCTFYMIELQTDFPRLHILKNTVSNNRNEIWGRFSIQHFLKS